MSGGRPLHQPQADMHPTTLRQHLERSDQYVAEGEYHLEQQRARIERLRQQGARTEVARAAELLRQMKNLLAIHIEHRDKLRILLEQRTHDDRSR